VWTPGHCPDSVRTDIRPDSVRTATQATRGDRKNENLNDRKSFVDRVVVRLRSLPAGLDPPPGVLLRLDGAAWLPRRACLVVLVGSLLRPGRSLRPDRCVTEHAVARLQKQKQKPTKRLIRTRLFIIGLTALSIYANYEHAAQFSTTMLDKVTGQTLFNLPLDFFKFGTLNPILGSFFQLFAIAYTSMAEDIASEEPEEAPEEDLDTLRKRAAEAEERARLQTTISASREPQGRKLVKGMFGLVKGVRAEVKDLRGEPQDKEAEMLERAVGFLREMPHLR
jgi:hypothetical protein